MVLVVIEATKPGQGRGAHVRSSPWKEVMVRARNSMWEWEWKEEVIAGGRVFLELR
jgi:hypothetical protein